MPEELPFEATLAYVFRGSGGKKTAIEAARLVSSTDERFKRLVYAYDSASEQDKASIQLEDLLGAADLSADEFLANVVPALWRRNVDLGRVISAVSHPMVVNATITNAVTGGSFGVADRRMLLEHEGFLPTKQGMQINVDASHKNLVAGGKGGSVTDTSGPGLPAFEDDIAFIADTLQNPPSLLSGSIALLPAAREEQRITVPEEEEIPEGEIVQSE
jgi:hypothetical protein